MKKTLLVAAFALLASGAAMAQDCCKKGEACSHAAAKNMTYSYIEAQGGLEWTTTNAPISKLLMPVGAISLGHYFTPVVGARLHASGLQAKGRFEGLDRDYKWNFVTTDADLLINLSNLFSKNYDRPLNLILVGGVGLVNAWKNDDIQAIIAEKPTLAPLAWDNRHHLSHNLRAGLRLETNMTKPLGLSLELAANDMDDRFNAKTNDADDWMISAMIGVNWRFGRGKCKHTAAPVVEEPKPVVVEEPKPVVEEPAPVVVEEPKPVVVEEPKPQPKAVVKSETLHEEIFYIICKSDPTENGESQLQRVANFMKKYKDAKVQIVGYADKGTGNPEINVMYAERRAAQCKDTLVNKYGCEAARIQIDSKGDTVQPFAENDKNRCVIIDSKAQYTVYE